MGSRENSLSYTFSMLLAKKCSKPEAVSLGSLTTAEDYSKPEVASPCLVTMVKLYDALLCCHD